MSLLDTWRRASRRANVVRTVGLLVAVVIGVPLAVPMLTITLDSLRGVFAADVGSLLLVAWGVAALGGLGVSSYALLVMPALDEAASRRCVRWAIAGTLAALPALIMPAVGVALVGAGVAVCIELETLRVDRRAAASA